MRLRSQIAVWVLAAAFAAAPALAAVAADCMSCCCPPTLCHDGSSECDVALSSASCCAEAPTALPAVAKRTLEAPSLLAVPQLRALPLDEASRVRPPEPATVLDALASLLRLSVVLTL